MDSNISTQIQQNSKHKSTLNKIIETLQYARAPTHIQKRYLQKQSRINHIFDTTGRKENIDTLLQGNNQHVWRHNLTNELGYLLHGIRDVAGMDCI